MTVIGVKVDDDGLYLVIKRETTCLVLVIMPDSGMLTMHLNNDFVFLNYHYKIHAVISLKVIFRVVSGKMLVI